VSPMDARDDEQRLDEEAQRQEWRHALDRSADLRPAGNPTDPTAAAAHPVAPAPTPLRAPDPLAAAELVPFGAAAAVPAAEPTAPAPAPARVESTTPLPHAPHVADPSDLVLAARGLRVAFSGNEILHGVDLDAPRGGVLALVGPSGCGKTTLLRSINRLTELTPTATIGGQILFDGHDVYGGGTDLNLLRRRIGMVFQQPNPFPMTIFDNVAFAIREQAKRRPSRGELMPQVADVLQRAGLWDEVKDNLDRNALSLSGGQQQRLCIARTLAANPEVILMDEPCSALDPRSTARIEELIVQLAGSLTIVIVTHNLAQAKRIADYAAYLLNGDLIEQGLARQVFEAPENQSTRDFVAGMFG
jgi:phosphate transport system ATP-binding protein